MVSASSRLLGTVQRDDSPAPSFGGSASSRLLSGIRDEEPVEVRTFESTIPTPTQAAPEPQPDRGIFARARESIFDNIKGLDLMKISQSLRGGVKAVPGQFKQGAGVILESIADNTKFLNNFFTSKVGRAVTTALAPAAPILPGISAAAQLTKPVTGRITPIVEREGEKIREVGFEEAGRAREEFRKTFEPTEKGLQKYLELAAFNIPQMATTAALTAATAAITKNPAAATAVGLSTSYGLGASEVYNEARSFGLSDQEALPYAQIGGYVLAPLEFLPLDKMLRNTGAVKTVQNSIIKNVAQRLLQTGTQAGFEGITEGLQEIVGNAIANMYGQHKNLFEGLTEATVVGTLLGAFGDISFGGVISDDGKANTVEEITKKVEEKVSEAIETPAEKRTPEQQAVVDAVTTQELTPDQALKFVSESNLKDDPDIGKISLAAVQAQQEGKNVLISRSVDDQSLEIKIAEPSTVISESGKLIGKVEVEEAEVLEVETIEKLQTELKEVFKSADREKVEQAIFEIYSELEVAEAGQRLFSEDGEFTGAIKSTFPDWIPSELRTRKLFDSVMDGFTDLNNIQYPPNTQPKKQALYDVLLNEIDLRAGTDSSNIIERLKNVKKETKQQIEKGVDRGTERGEGARIKEGPLAKDLEKKKAEIAARAKKPQAKPTEKKPIPAGFKQSKVIERVADTLRSEVDLNETLYKTLSLDDAAKMAVDIVNNQPELTQDIISGNAPVPEGTTKAAVLIAVAEQARKAGDFKTQKDRVIQRSFMQTRHGQEIVTERLVNDLSSDRFIRDVLKVRMDKITGKVKKGVSKAKAFTDKVSSNARGANRKVKKRALTKIESAQQLIDNLRCK